MLTIFMVCFDFVFEGRRYDNLASLPYNLNKSGRKQVSKQSLLSCDM